MAHQPELLDIGQAAALLGVSEMSLRRWTNAGRLPCLRVGGRRERRFRRADLLAFLERPSATAKASQALNHLCGLYTSAASRERQAASYLADGLRAGSSCFLVAEAGFREGVLENLSRRWPSVRRDSQAGRLVVSRLAPTGAEQLEYWETRFADATAAGVESLRALGDVSGGRLGRHRSFAEVLAYERELDRLLAVPIPVSILCLYDARRLTGVQVSQLLRVHDDLFRHPGDLLES